MFWPGIAAAFCSAPPPKVCSAYFQANVVVRGKVLSVNRGADWIVYKIRVEKTFKGQDTSERILYTGNDSGRLPLDVGRDYVLFAYRSSHRLELSCNEEPLSNSASVARVSQAISRLRASRAALATVEGQILTTAYSEPLPGVSVVVVGAAHIYKTMSDSRGLFSIQVPPGHYRVDVDPAIVKQTIYSMIYTNPESIHLTHGQCAQLQYRAVHR